MAGGWGRTLGTVVPATRVARPTVMDWRLQVFFFSHSGHIGADSCWGAGSGPCAISGFLYLAGSVAPFTAAPARVIFLEVNNELRVHFLDLRRKSRDSGRELCNGGIVTRCGRY